MDNTQRTQFGRTKIDLYPISWTHCININKTSLYIINLKKNMLKI